MTPRLTLKAGRDKPVRAGHPWIFSGAVTRLEGDAEPGDLTAVHAAGGEALGWAYLNPRSQIVGRMLSRDPAERVDTAFWRRRLEAAVRLRAALPGSRLAQPEGACRLVNAESDGLPGLVIDRYGPYLVLQALSAGIEVRKAELAQLAAEILASAGQPCAGVYERSDVEVRAKEGLAPRAGALLGEPPPRLWLWERGPLDGPDARGSIPLPVDILGGHKTGAYLDQSVNRRRVAAYAAGRRVLNVFCYTGGFGIHARAGGAAGLVQLDSSGPALRMAAEALSRAGHGAEGQGSGDPGGDLVEGDAFTRLRDWRDTGQTFDLIVLDPPKFVHHAGQLTRAARAYKDINLLALKLLAPGGILATFSCSGLVSAELFQQIVFGAAVDAGREVAILERLGQAPDHPAGIFFPEGTYLKGLLCRAAG